MQLHVFVLICVLREQDVLHTANRCPVVPSKNLKKIRRRVLAVVLVLWNS